MLARSSDANGAYARSRSARGESGGSPQILAVHVEWIGRSAQRGLGRDGARIAPRVGTVAIHADRQVAIEAGAAFARARGRSRELTIRNPLRVKIEVDASALLARESLYRR